MGRAALVWLLAAGCFSPAPQAGAQCSDRMTCPAPLVCAADNTCQEPGYVVPDAPPMQIDANAMCGVDEAPCVTDCGADPCLKPAHVATGFGGFAAGVTNAVLGTSALNTTTGAIGTLRAANTTPATYQIIGGIGFVRRPQATGPAIAIWVFGDLVVTGTITATGDAAVVLASAGSITVSAGAIIDVGASALVPGAGGFPGGTYRTTGTGCGGGGAPAGTGTSGDTGQTEGGGGGGGFGTNGAAGGSAPGVAGPGGAITTCAAVLTTILAGGSGGGGGDTSGTVPGPFGGGGGGALQLSSMGKLIIGGTLSAGGGGGRTAEGNGRDGAGGGAGGTIFLDAPAITISASAGLYANGGGGGSASAGAGGACLGPIAENGKRSLAVAAGSQCAAGFGGNGAAGTTSAAAGQAGTGGGGGGGGLGRIVVRTLPGNAPIIGPASLSPSQASPAFTVEKTLD